MLERAITFCENGKITIGDLQLREKKNSQNPDDFLEPLLNEIERDTIFNALSQSKNNKTKAAKLLGINIGAFRYRLDKYKK